MSKVKTPKGRYGEEVGAFLPRTEGKASHELLKANVLWQKAKSKAINTCIKGRGVAQAWSPTYCLNWGKRSESFRLRRGFAFDVIETAPLQYLK